MFQSDIDPFIYRQLIAIVAAIVTIFQYIRGSARDDLKNQVAMAFSKHLALLVVYGRVFKLVHIAKIDNNSWDMG